MTEFNVDTGCLEDAGELDCVILHDEMDEMDDMKFVPDAKDSVKTCKNIGDEFNPLHEVDQFVCSRCGIHLEDWCRVVYDYDHGISRDKTFYEYVMEYCPHCGAKVAE